MVRDGRPRGIFRDGGRREKTRRQKLEKQKIAMRELSQIHKNNRLAKSTRELSGQEAGVGGSVAEGAVEGDESELGC
jgi:hypothetical protein